MPEEAEKKSSAWPFFGISLLILLLAAFLYVRLSKKERPASPTDRVESRGADTDKADPKDPQESQREKLIARAREFLRDGKFDAAESAVEDARKIREGDDLTALLSEIETARREIAELADRKYSTALEEVSTRWYEVWKKENLWDEASRAVGEFEKAHARAESDERFVRVREDVAKNRAQHDEAFRSNLALARDLHGKGRVAEALQKLQVALSLYPERTAEVDTLRKDWEVVFMEKEMVRITDLEATVGSDDHEDEKPKRKIKLKPFKIDRYEVTNEEYAVFLASQPDRPAPLHWRGRKYPPEKAKHPITFVSRKDAEAYAKWAGKRLPTEEEWEKAARFVDGRTYPWGEEFTPPGSGQFFANSTEFWTYHKDRATGTLPVGSFPNGKSGFDVYDMAGNAWEWTSTPATTETNGTKKEYGVLKGGSYMTTKEALRCSNRLLDEPDFGHPDYGFRCAKDSP
jgi:formylglycine-generating enzyme required for sulfatase activity